MLAHTVVFLFTFVDTSGTECKDIFSPENCKRKAQNHECWYPTTQFFCAKTCNLYMKKQTWGYNITCEDPNTNKECKNLLQGKISLAN